MYNKIYAVMFNDSLSSEGYYSIHDAMKYCADRAERQTEFGWIYKDNRGNIYKIYEIKIV